MLLVDFVHQVIDRFYPFFDRRSAFNRLLLNGLWQVLSQSWYFCSRNIVEQDYQVWKRTYERSLSSKRLNADRRSKNVRLYIGLWHFAHYSQIAYI